MKTVDVHEAESTLSALLAGVEQGEEVTIARGGTPVAKLVRVTVGHRREPGLLCGDPAWRGVKFDAELFAPVSDADLADEGWL